MSARGAVLPVVDAVTANNPVSELGPQRLKKRKQELLEGEKLNLFILRYEK